MLQDVLGHGAIERRAEQERRQAPRPRHQDGDGVSKMQPLGSRPKGIFLAAYDDDVLAGSHPSIVHPDGPRPV